MTSDDVGDQRVAELTDGDAFHSVGEVVGVGVDHGLAEPLARTLDIELAVLAQEQCLCARHVADPGGPARLSEGEKTDALVGRHVRGIHVTHLRHEDRHGCVDDLLLVGGRRHAPLGYLGFPDEVLQLLTNTHVVFQSTRVEKLHFGAFGTQRNLYLLYTNT